MTDGIDSIKKYIVESRQADPLPGKKDRDVSLREAAQSFEAFFIFSLLKEMRKTIPKGGLTGAGSGQAIYQSLLDETLANKMSETGGIGLSKLLVQKYK